MSRWFRHYAGMMRDEKLVSAALRAKQPVERVIWIWGAILESAAEINDHGRYELESAEAAYFLRSDEADICAVLDALTNLKRLADGRVVNWGARQFDSDRSAPRQAAYRERKRERDRHIEQEKPSGDGVVTAASRHGDAPELETETETEKNSVAGATDAEASPAVYLDSKHELWGEGIPILVALGVKNPRPIVGRWLRDAKDDAQKVLGAIQRARDARVIDPVPWITRAISTEAANGRPDQRLSSPAPKGGLVAAGERLLARLSEASGEQLGGLGGSPGNPPIRLLPERRSG